MGMSHTAGRASNSSVLLTAGNGHGSTNTKVRKFTNAVTVGSALTYTASATLGDKVVVNASGIYAIRYADSCTGAASIFGISINSAEGTTSVATIVDATCRGVITAAAASGQNLLWVGTLTAADVVWMHTDGACDSTSVKNSRVLIQLIAPL